MTPFEYVTAVALLILGLGITGLLRALIEVFKARDIIRVDVISLTWGISIFAVQMQFLWGLYELNRLIPIWTASNFMLIVTLALLLFAAGVLVLPRDPGVPGRDPAREFALDGRWALIALSAYFCLAYVANHILFGVGFFHPLNVLALLLGILALTTFLVRTHRVRVVTTVLFVVLLLPAIVIWSPPAYQAS